MWSYLRSVYLVGLVVSISYGKGLPMPRSRFARLAPQRQCEILEAAAEEFVQHGFQAASFNRIIEKAGLSKGAMYYYFDDKQDLFLTVFERYQAQLLKQIPPLGPVADPADFWQKLEQLFKQTVAIKLNNSKLIQIGIVMIKSLASGELNLPYVRAFQIPMSWAGEVVAVGQSVGAIRKDLLPDCLVFMALGMMESLDMWLLLKFRDLDHQSLMEKVDMKEMISCILDLLRRIWEPGARQCGPLLSEELGGI